VNKIIFVLVVIIMSSTISFAENWKYGFCMDDNIYFDRNHSSSKGIYFFILKWDLIPKNINKNDAGMVFITGKYAIISETGRDRPSMGSVGGLKEIKLKHKLENKRNYISEDGKKWEELKIVYVKDTGEKNIQKEPLVLVKFECSYFSGVYEIVYEKY